MVGTAPTKVALGKTPNNTLQRTVLPSLRYGKPTAELKRYVSKK